MLKTLSAPQGVLIRASPSSMVVKISMSHIGKRAPHHKGWVPHLQEVVLAAAGEAGED